MIVVQGGLVDGTYSSHRQILAVVIDGDVFEGVGADEGDSWIMRATHQAHQVKTHVALHGRSAESLQGSNAEPSLITNREPA